MQSNIYLNAKLYYIKMQSNIYLNVQVILYYFGSKKILLFPRSSYPSFSSINCGLLMMVLRAFLFISCLLIVQC